MANHLCDFDPAGEMMYTINEGMSEIVQLTEYHFMYLFVAMERLAVPIYLHITESITLFEAGHKDACIQKIKSIRTHLHSALQAFYKTLVSTKVSEKKWMSHLQGFHGWAAGGIENGDYVEYDGVSGSYSLLVQVIDAYLGMDAYLSPQASLRHIPARQRAFVDSVRGHSFRGRAFRDGDEDVERCMSGIARSMQMFRSSHRRTTSKYLGASASERRFMTAEKSILEIQGGPPVSDVLKDLDANLAARLNQTKQTPKSPVAEMERT